MVNSYDQFAVHDCYTEICDALREIQQQHQIKTFERALLAPGPGGVTRPTLAGLAGSDQPDVFVATVERRGFSGKRRSVLLQNLRRFGLKFIFADHVWVPYDKNWERLEPFFQGLALVLVGTALEYKRNDRTSDYTLRLTKVVRLWEMPDRRTSPTPYEPCR
jgi:hypothetical protein